LIQRHPPPHPPITFARRWDPKFRVLCMKLLTLNVPPNSIKEIFASVACAILGDEKCIADLRLPDDRFYSRLRSELAVLQQIRAGFAFATSTRVKEVATDASPLPKGQGEMAASPVQLVEQDGTVRKWCGTGAYLNKSQTAIGETGALAHQVVSPDIP